MIEEFLAVIQALVSKKGHGTNVFTICVPLYRLAHWQHTLCIIFFFFFLFLFFFFCVCACVGGGGGEGGWGAGLMLHENCLLIVSVVLNSPPVCKRYRGIREAYLVIIQS